MLSLWLYGANIYRGELHGTRMGLMVWYDVWSQDPGTQTFLQHEDPSHPNIVFYVITCNF